MSVDMNISPSEKINRKKVLVSAYAISPHLGSEYGVGWNFVTRLAKKYDLVVLFGTCGGRMGTFAELDDYIRNNPLNGVTFVHVSIGYGAKIFDWLNHHVSRLFFPVAFNLYQRKVLRIARKMTKDGSYDLIHQLNPIGFRFPGHLWRLGVPFVWGPVGGTSKLHKSLFSVLPCRERIRHRIRNLSNDYFLTCSHGVENAIRASSAVFCATAADSANLRKLAGMQLPVVPENAVRVCPAQPRKTRTPIKLVWMGRIDGAKALNLLLEALVQLKDLTGWSLTIVGDGPELSVNKRFATENGLDDRISWTGLVDRTAAQFEMRNADLHIMTSLMDSNPTVLLEAFECGVPSMALDQFGAADLIPDDGGIRIPVSDKNSIVDTLAIQLRNCIVNPEKIDLMKRKVVNVALDMSWESNIAKVENVYDGVMNAG